MSVPNDPKMALQGTKSSHMYALHPPCHKFQSISLYDQLFSSSRVFWEKCSEWLQNYDEVYIESKVRYVLLASLNSICHCTASRFKLEAFLGQCT